MLLRSFISFLLSFFLIIILTKFYMKRKKFGIQPIREDGPQSHLLTKANTPTMGGILIISVVFLVTVILGKIKNIYCLLGLITLLSYGIIGFLDDYKKISKHNYHGMRASTKFCLQILFASLIGYFIYINLNNTYVCGLELKWLFIPWICFIITGSSNAVNLNDGLDGLALGTIVTCTTCFLYICYLNQNINEVCIILSALLGASLGFLFFNINPAKIFMGDTGALAIGGFLGYISVISKCEFLYALIGGIFVIETISVVMQVTYYKFTHKRILPMAPLHHCFEKFQIKEPTIVFAFWIVSIFLSITGMFIFNLMH